MSEWTLEFGDTVRVVAGPVVAQDARITVVPKNDEALLSTEKAKWQAEKDLDRANAAYDELLARYEMVQSELRAVRTQGIYGAPQRLEIGGEPRADIPLDDPPTIDVSVSGMEPDPTPGSDSLHRTGIREFLTMRERRDEALGLLKRVHLDYAMANMLELDEEISALLLTTERKGKP